MKEGLCAVLEKCRKLESFSFSFPGTFGKSQEKILAMLVEGLARKMMNLKRLVISAVDISIVG